MEQMAIVRDHRKAARPEGPPVVLKLSPPARHTCDYNAALIFRQPESDLQTARWQVATRHLDARLDDTVLRKEILQHSLCVIQHAAGAGRFYRQLAFVVGEALQNRRDGDSGKIIEATWGEK